MHISILLFFFFSLISASFPPPFSVSSRSAICSVLIDEDPPSGVDVTPAQPVQASTRTAVTPRIINGDLVSKNLQPYLVSLLTPSGSSVSLCTGTLVHPEWVVTAAHCESDTTTRVYVGLNRLPFGQSKDFVKVAEVKNHESYNSGSGFKYDMALIKLAKPVKGRFMRVSIERGDPKESGNVRVVGYGYSRATLEDTPAEDGWLRQVDLPVYSNSACKSTFSLVDTEFQVCVGYERGGCDSCQGDSGGPLIRYSAGEPILVGVTSTGRGCALPRLPGIYARTSSFHEWFNKKGLQYNTFGSSSLSTGAIAGIVIVILAVVVVAVVAAIFIRKKRHGGADGNIYPVSDQPSFAPGPPAAGGPQIPAGQLYALPADAAVPAGALVSHGMPMIPQPGVPQVSVPMYTPPQHPHNEAPNAMEQEPQTPPQYSHAQYAPPQYSQEQYTQPQMPPQYSQEQYTQPQTPTQYSQEQYTQPQMPPQYSQEQYTQPQMPPHYSQEQYTQPQTPPQSSQAPSAQPQAPPQWFPDQMQQGQQGNNGAPPPS